MSSRAGSAASARATRRTRARAPGLVTRSSPRAKITSIAGLGQEAPRRAGRVGGARVGARGRRGSSPPSATAGGGASGGPRARRRRAREPRGEDEVEHGEVGEAERQEEA